MYYLKKLNEEHRDRKKAAANVSQFLLNDFPEIMNRADRNITDITSPNLTGTPNHSTINTQEKMIIDHINYNAVFDCIADTYIHVSNGPDQHQSIIKYLYLYKLDRTNASQRLGIDTSTLDRRKIDALCEFADRFETQKHKPEHEVDWIPSFWEST